MKDVLAAAFRQFPRLGYLQPPAHKKEETLVKLRAWSTNPANQTLYHNSAMACCRISIREISKRRAIWHDKQQQNKPGGPEGPGNVEAAAVAETPAEGLRVPAPSTPAT